MVPTFAMLAAAMPAAEQAPLDPVEPQAAISAFIDSCWRGIRDPEAFDSAVQKIAPSVQRSAEGKAFRLLSREWKFYYYPGGTCTLTFQIRTTAEAMQIADRLADRLGLRRTENHWAADASPPLALWQFRQVPVDRSYYALWVYARQPRRFDAIGPSEVEISVSHGFGR